MLLLRVVEASGNGSGEHRHARAVADTDLTASVGHVAAWVPALFGAVGGLFALLLLVDVVRR